MRIEIDGRRTGLDDSGGTGAPLVLLHGFPLDRRIWAAQVRGLADVARVIAPDLRGFGESAMPRGPGPAVATTMDAYAADVAGLLDALGIDTAVIGGVSMGGYVAMAFHRKFADRLRGIVLVDTRGGPDSAEARKARDAAAATARARGAAAVAAPMLEKMLTPAGAAADGPLRRALLDLMGSQPVEGIVGALGAIRDRPDSGPSVARIAVPALVVCGAEDTLIPPRESEALRDAIPGARLSLIPGAAHLPNYEQPEAFNRVLREFLGTLP
jgi:pimeloyl-ACP methyl ester carboxylesterase